MKKSHYSTATLSGTNSSFFFVNLLYLGLGCFTDRLLNLYLVAQQHHISIKLLAFRNERMHLSIGCKMSPFCWFICQEEIVKWDFFILFEKIHQIFKGIGLWDLNNHFLKIFLFLLHDQYCCAYHSILLIMAKLLK